jgi:PleD family two-component response regulator
MDARNKYKVLIIDDSSVNNVLLENVLEDQNFDVLVAFSGKDAFILMDKQMPDIILLDIMMPEMDGFKILEAIKSSEKTKSIPVIMISAKSDVVDIDKSLELGAADYIVKPINIRTIIGKIEQNINNYKV